MSAAPGASNSPKGVCTFCVGRKSPVTCTFTAFGAARRNVTVWSGWISGDTICEPPHRACWASAPLHAAAATASSIIYFFMMLYLVYFENCVSKNLMILGEQALQKGQSCAPGRSM